MQHEKAVRAEEDDERRGNQRIDVRLRKVQPFVALGIFALQPSEERERARAAYLDVLAGLQEYAFGPGKLFPDANQILALVLEVEISREAVPEHVVGRLVALEADCRSHSENRPTRQTQRSMMPSSAEAMMPGLVVMPSAAARPPWAMSSRTPWRSPRFPAARPRNDRPSARAAPRPATPARGAHTFPFTSCTTSSAGPPLSLQVTTALREAKASTVTNP